VANVEWKNAFTNETFAATAQVVLAPYQYIVLKK
jgi:uncharacterized protein YutD